MINNNHKNIRRNQGGFTLVETLVAIFILIISITGPLAVAQSGLRAAFLSRDQTTAFYLAQDAIEFVKNKRDDNVIDNVIIGSAVDWLDGFDGCETASGCTIDTTTESGTIANCSLSDPGCDAYNPLKYDSVNYQFGHSGADDSIFTRVVYISETEVGKEAEVKVKITWTSSPTVGLREIEVREYIYNWLNV